MESTRLYILPKLAYGYGDLKPFLSEDQLRIHYEKHHQSYVNNANALLQKIDKAHKESTDFDMKATLKDFSFNIGGHVLHSLFWGNLTPPSKAGGKPSGNIGDAIEKDFGSFERFKKEFSQTAASTEGSGWAALAYCTQTKRLLLMQIEKHNTNVYPMFRILLILDVFEHAYYVDYKNDRGKFIEAFWNSVNWDAVNTRFKEILK